MTDIPLGIITAETNETILTPTGVLRFKNDVYDVGDNVGNDLYKDNLQAILELMDLLDEVKGIHEATPYEYVETYGEGFYTYETWEELVNSEIAQGDIAKDECIKMCKEQMGKRIWQLPCGLYVQYVD